MYGLSGASGKLRHIDYKQPLNNSNVGRHCCVWCTITSADLIKPLSKRNLSPLRSLETLNEDLRKFMQESGGDINKAKFHNNVIGPAMLDIPLDMVYR